MLICTGLFDSAARTCGITPFAAAELAADKLGIPCDNIFAAASRESLIYRTVYAAAPELAAVTFPELSVCSTALSAFGCKIAPVPLSAADGYSVCEDVFERIPKGVQLAYIASPSGAALPFEAAQEFAEGFFAHGGYLIADEYAACDIRIPQSGRTAFIGELFVSEGDAVFKAAYIACPNSGFMKRIRLCGPRDDQPLPICKPHTVEYIARERGYMHDCLKNLSIRCFASDSDRILAHSPLPLCTDRRECTAIDDGLYSITLLSHEENVSLVAEITRSVSREVHRLKRPPFVI